MGGNVIGIGNLAERVPFRQLRALTASHSIRFSPSKRTQPSIWLSAANASNSAQIHYTNSNPRLATQLQRRLGGSERSPSHSLQLNQSDDDRTPSPSAPHAIALPSLIPRKESASAALHLADAHVAVPTPPALAAGRRPRPSTAPSPHRGADAPVRTLRGGGRCRSGAERGYLRTRGQRGERAGR
jgi:hypothetical protein